MAAKIDPRVREDAPFDGNDGLFSLDEPPAATTKAATTSSSTTTAAPPAKNAVGVVSPVGSSASAATAASSSSEATTMSDSKEVKSSSATPTSGGKPREVRSGSLALPEPPQCAIFFEPKEWSARYAAAFFTAEITGAAVSAEGHAIYHILIKCANAEWQVSRRFSEFDTLLTALKASSLVDASTLPTLPAKTWTRDTSVEFICARRVELATFLQAVLRVNQHRISQHRLMRTFLDLDHVLPPQPEVVAGEFDDDAADDAEEAAQLAAAIAASKLVQ